MIGKDSRHVKEAVKLKQKKYRELQNKYIIEGIRFIEEGIKSSKVHYILYSSKLFKTSGYERILNESCPAFEVSDDIISILADTENPQGAVAVAEKNLYTLNDIKNKFIVVLDEIQDPGNMGTIIRTADAAGAGGLIVIKGSADVYSSKALRATMGSIFHIPIVFYDNFKEASFELKNNDYRLYSTSPEAKKYLYDCNFKDNTAIVIGNEARGMSKDDIELCHEKIKIPMIGKAESLNAAVACSVIIYEVVRQRLTT